MDLKKFFLDLLFPVSCIGCGKAEFLVCSNCLQKIRVKPEVQADNINYRLLDGVWSVADYHDLLLQKIIYHYKYKFIKDLDGILGGLVERYLNQLIAARTWPKIDIVIPVPLSSKRQRYRGFNQSELIARQISQKLNLPLETKLLLRKWQNPQVGLTAIDRQQNIKDAFKINQAKSVRRCQILLVDDIITTGATLEECSRVLKTAGAKKVFALVIASN